MVSKIHIISQTDWRLDALKSWVTPQSMTNCTNSRIFLMPHHKNIWSMLKFKIVEMVMSNKKEFSLMELKKLKMKWTKMAKKKRSKTNQKVDQLPKT